MIRHTRSLSFPFDIAPSRFTPILSQDISNSIQNLSNQYINQHALQPVFDVDQASKLLNLKSLQTATETVDPQTVDTQNTSTIYIPHPEEAATATRLPQADPIRLCPVIDPKTLRIKENRLNDMLLAIRNTLPPATNNKTEIKLRTTLENVLVDLGFLAHDTETQCTLSRLSGYELDRQNLNLSFATQDLLNQAKTLSQKLAKHPRKTTRVSEGYATLSLLFQELKYAHFSAAAKNHIALAAEMEAEREYPHLTRNLHGGKTVRSLFMELGATFGCIPLPKAGPTITPYFGASRTSTYLNDNDGDVDLWKSAKTYLGLNLSVGNAEGTFFGSLISTLGYSKGNNYFQARHIKDILKMSIMESARHSIFRGTGSKTRTMIETCGEAIPTGLLPYYNPVNLEKGAFNRVLLGILARQISQCFESPLFERAIRSAYPSLAELEQYANEYQPAETAQTMPISALGSEMSEYQPSQSHNPFVSMAPLSAPAAATQGNSATRRSDSNFAKRADLALSGGVKNPPLLDGDLNPYIGAQATLTGALVERGFHLERLHEAAAHMALHPAVIKSYPKIFEIMLSLSRYYNDQNPNASRMALSRKISEALERTDQSLRHIGHPEQEFDFACYGNPHAINRQIPESIIHSIQRPHVEKLEVLSRQAKKLQQSYTQFLAAAETICTRKLSRSTSFNTHLTLQDEQQQALDTINTEAFDGHLSEQQIQALAKDPRKLVAQAYDAYSLATGHLGVHLGVMNRELARLYQQKSEFSSDQEREALNEANLKYSKLKTSLDAFNAPLNVDYLLRNSSIGALGKVLQTQKIASANLLLGPSAIGMNTGLETPFNNGSVSLTSNASINNIAFTLTYTKKETKEHGNQGRLGTYHDFSFEVAQCVAPGYKLTNSIVNALAAHMGYMAQKAGDIGEEEAMSLKDWLVWIIQDPISTSGSSFNVAFHRFPTDESNNNYANRLQYARWTQNTNQAISLNTTVPVLPNVAAPVFSSVSASISAGGSETIQDTVKEILGSDLNIHLMFLRDLTQTREGVNTTIEDTLSNRQSSVRQKLLGGTGLQELMRDYEAFLTQRHDPNRPRTGFDFYHTQRFSNYARYMRELKHYAPGGNAEHLLGTHPKQPLDNGYRFASEAEKALVFNTLLPRLESCRTLDERSVFLLNEGKPLLNAYLGMLAHYYELNLAGYQINYPRTLRDSKGQPNPKTEKKIQELTEGTLAASPRAKQPITPKRLIRQLSNKMTDLRNPHRIPLRSMSMTDLTAQLQSETLNPQDRKHAQKEYLRRHL